MSTDAVPRGPKEPVELAHLSEGAREIVAEETEILSRIGVRLEREATTKPNAIEDLDAQMIELRDAISEAK